MDKGLYEYDEQQKQYRRKYPKETIQAPDRDEAQESADIYGVKATPNDDPFPHRRKPGKPPGERAKAVFWFCFVIVCGFWFYLIYSYMNKEKEERNRIQQLDEKPAEEEPVRDIKLRP